MHATNSIAEYSLQLSFLNHRHVPCPITHTLCSTNSILFILTLFSSFLHMSENEKHANINNFTLNLKLLRT